MQRWVGRYLIAVGLLHTAAGIVLYRQPLAAIIRAGGGTRSTLISIAIPRSGSWSLAFCLCWLEASSTGSRASTCVHPASSAMDSRR